MVRACPACRRIFDIVRAYEQAAVVERTHVRIGQHIGNVGHTGVATGNHLHFELRKNGKPQNPLQWVILKDSRSKKSH